MLSLPLDGESVSCIFLKHSVENDQKINSYRSIHSLKQYLASWKNPRIVLMAAEFAFESCSFLSCFFRWVWIQVNLTLTCSLPASLSPSLSASLTVSQPTLFPSLEFVWGLREGDIKEAGGEREKKRKREAVGKNVQTTLSKPVVSLCNNLQMAFWLVPHSAHAS